MNNKKAGFFMLKNASISYEELVELIEDSWEDESITSNYWENKYKFTKLQNLLPHSVLIIDQVAYVNLLDGLHAVDVEVEESPCTQYDVLLFEVESIRDVRLDELESSIKEKQEVIKKLNTLKSLVLE